MKCSKCDDFDKKKGCTSIMDDYCDGSLYFIPRTKMGFWDYVGLLFSVVILASSVGFAILQTFK